MSAQPTPTNNELAMYLIYSIVKGTPETSSSAPIQLSLTQMDLVELREAVNHMGFANGYDFMPHANYLGNIIKKFTTNVKFNIISETELFQNLMECLVEYYQYFKTNANVGSHTSVCDFYIGVLLRAKKLLETSLLRKAVAESKVYNSYSDVIDHFMKESPRLSNKMLVTLERLHDIVMIYKRFPDLISSRNYDPKRIAELADRYSEVSIFVEKRNDYEHRLAIKLYCILNIGANEDSLKRLFDAVSEVIYNRTSRILAVSKEHWLPILRADFNNNLDSISTLSHAKRIKGYLDTFKSIFAKIVEHASGFSVFDCYYMFSKYCEELCCEDEATIPYYDSLRFYSHAGMLLRIDRKRSDMIDIMLKQCKDQCLFGHYSKESESSFDYELKRVIHAILGMIMNSMVHSPTAFEKVRSTINLLDQDFAKTQLRNEACSSLSMAVNQDRDKLKIFIRLIFDHCGKLEQSSAVLRSEIAKIFKIAATQFKHDLIRDPVELIDLVISHITQFYEVMGEIKLESPSQHGRRVLNIVAAFCPLMEPDFLCQVEKLTDEASQRTALISRIESAALELRRSNILALPEGFEYNPELLKGLLSRILDLFIKTFESGIGRPPIFELVEETLHMHVLRLKAPALKK